MQIYLWYLEGYIQIFFASETAIYANRLLSVAPEYNIAIINSSVTFPFKTHITEIHASGYRISTLDLQLNLPENRLLYPDISYNHISDIGPKVLRNLIFLKKLDLSNNQLSQTKLFTETFSTLFQSNKALTNINLASNGLKYIPRNTISFNTALKYLKLSGNSLSQITFDISKLVHLDIVDLKDNSIENLDETSRNIFDNLCRFQQRHRNHTKVIIRLTFIYKEIRCPVTVILWISLRGL